MRVLVTGGFGYLGGRIAQALCDAGVEVVLGSRKERKAPVWLPQAVIAELVWGDQEKLQSICEQVDAVIHTAGMNVQDCANNPAGAMEFNGGASARLIQASAISNVKKFIYLSTAHIYCSPLVGVVTEDTCPLNRHPYAVSHRAAEDLLLHFVNKNRNMAGTVLRLSNSVGAPAHKQANCWMLVVNDLCRQVVVDQQMRLLSDESVLRDYISISAVCTTVSVLLESDQQSGEIVNLSSGSALTLGRLTELIADRSEAVLGFRPAISFNRTSSPIAVESLEISNSKLKKIGINVETGISDEIDQLLLRCKQWFGK
jgi:UDP-glucose 4-epimerase